MYDAAYPYDDDNDAARFDPILGQKRPAVVMQKPPHVALPRRSNNEIKLCGERRVMPMISQIAFPERRKRMQDVVRVMVAWRRWK